MQIGVLKETLTIIFNYGFSNKGANIYVYRVKLKVHGYKLINDQGGVPKDPRFVFRAFYYFYLRFFHRSPLFFLIV